ncbi:MAG TPA: MASE4 domain-containing protein, partial [Hyphomonadaceae bacterium]|nr:MASE4 domain-containing protein [Hyphomonadaceae bacterium]
MWSRASEDLSEFSVATAPATATHRRLAAFVIAAMLAAYVAVILFAPAPPQHIDSFVPTTYGIKLVADIVVAVLLFALFSASRSPALLVLASGYLFSSLMVLAQELTTPAVITPTGILGGKPQTASWLYFLWRFGFSASVLAYAFQRLRPRQGESATLGPRSAVLWAATIVLAVVCTLVFATTEGHDLFPPVSSGGRSLPLGRYINYGIMAVDFVALVLLARVRAKSILDLWLVVIVFGLLAECTMMRLFVDGPYT